MIENENKTPFTPKTPDEDPKKDPAPPNADGQAPTQAEEERRRDTGAREGGKR